MDVAFGILLLLPLTVVTPAQGQAPSECHSDTVLQDDVVAALTGIRPFNGLMRLEERSSIASRMYAASFLSHIMRRRGLEPQLHSFRDVESGIDASGVNVYALLPATVDSRRYVVLGAHYDTVDSPGANDNASGVALVIAVAGRILELNERRMHVVVVLFDLEEKKLVGSRAFAKWLKSWGEVHSVHTVDQVAWDSDGDRAVELELPTPTLEALYRGIAEQLDIPIHVTDVTTTDHHAFREAGFAAIGITEEYRSGDTTPFYHSKDDTYETVDFKYLASTTCMVGSAIAKIIAE